MGRQLYRARLLSLHGNVYSRLNILAIGLATSEFVVSYWL